VALGEVVFDGRRQLVRAVTITSDDVIVSLSLLREKRLFADLWLCQQRMAVRCWRVTTEGRR
jgi:hypothetical protein